MSEKTSAKGWITDGIKAAVVIVTSWQLFANEIHGYIDTRLEAMESRVVDKIGAVNAGQMLVVMDSTLQVVGVYYDSTCTRIANLEELVGVRPSNRTIITPPDTVALRAMERRMWQLEQGVEAILDGQSRSERRRAHNERDL